MIKRLLVCAAGEDDKLHALADLYVDADTDEELLVVWRHPFAGRWLPLAWRSA